MFSFVYSLLCCNLLLVWSHSQELVYLIRYLPAVCKLWILTLIFFFNFVPFSCMNASYPILWNQLYPLIQIYNEMSVVTCVYLNLFYHGCLGELAYSPPVLFNWIADVTIVGFISWMGYWASLFPPYTWISVIAIILKYLKCESVHFIILRFPHCYSAE